MVAFRLADELVLSVYAATRSFPDDERYGLVSQMRRASVSVAANIVEGSARRSQRDFVHFLRQAMGSRRETGYMLDLAQRLKYIDASRGQVLNHQYEHCAQKLGALIRSLER